MERYKFWKQWNHANILIFCTDYSGMCACMHVCVLQYLWAKKGSGEKVTPNTLSEASVLMTHPRCTPQCICVCVCAKQWKIQLMHWQLRCVLRKDNATQPLLIMFLSFRQLFCFPETHTDSRISYCLYVRLQAVSCSRGWRKESMSLILIHFFGIIAIHYLVKLISIYRAHCSLPEEVSKEMSEVLNDSDISIWRQSWRPLAGLITTKKANTLAMLT